MKTKEGSNILNEEKLEEVVGGHELQEFGWQGSEFDMPKKPEIEVGHIYTPVGSNSLESDKKEIEYIQIRPNE